VRATYSSSSIRIPRLTACCSIAQPTVGTYLGVFYLNSVICRKKGLPHGDMEIHITHLLSECHRRTQTSCGSYASNRQQFGRLICPIILKLTSVKRTCLRARP